MLMTQATTTPPQWFIVQTDADAGNSFAGLFQSKAQSPTNVALLKRFLASSLLYF